MKDYLKNHLSENRSFVKISYQNNILNNDFNNLWHLINIKAFLVIFNSSNDLKFCSKAPFSDILCRVEAIHLTFNKSQLTGFSMVWVFTERCL